MLDAWFGPSEEVARALVNAKAAKQGEYWLTRGPAPTFGIGGDEVIIPVETEVCVPTGKGEENEWVKLVSLLPRGVRVAVI